MNQSVAEPRESRLRPAAPIPNPRDMNRVQAVIALGDSFHNGGGPARMSDISRAALKTLQRGRDWLWIAGNHDPDPAENIGGRFAAILALGPLTFRPESDDACRARSRSSKESSCGAPRATQIRLRRS